MLILDKNSTQTNLERFLDCITPAVPSQFLSKSEMRKLNRLWHPWEREKVDYFTLGDLWSCYDEWSVYGVGVPISLDDGQNLIQYFVPYLSGIQIFTSNGSVNSLREETDSTSELRDSFSDSFSDESESEKLSRWDGCSSEEGLFEQDGFWHLNDKLGNLYFQYFETSSPYGRVPLMDKMSALAERYPRLLTLRSSDLSPASWMAVAWFASRSFSSIGTYNITFSSLVWSLNSLMMSVIQVSDLSHSNGQNLQGLEHRLSHIPHPFFFFSRHGP
ncbi:Hypothetical predicted protein [Olea europaea subsp. europaea]|uniref:DUF789 domain-containing protein n=1 Tax=Olea europaea subsp. europaea TaxID=158383 RepID=A0A8S0T0B8_OLEEU|nr:Hypothetical predicted protein [Olea europaea subsp. europaea]